MTSFQRMRGFTLAELLIAMAVAGLALALVMTTFQSQQRSFQSLETGRVARDATRDATMELQRTLRMAGFGIDPKYVFDFSHYACATQPCRDFVGQPDEIVFHARDANYSIDPDTLATKGNAWTLLAVSSSALFFTARKGDHFRKGQVLQLMCSGADSAHMVTVSSNNAPLTADGTTFVTLAPSVAGDPYKSNISTVSCLFGGGAIAYKVNRYRYYVDDTNVVPVPYLMLDEGFSDATGNPEVVPIARGIEDLQVSYVLAPSPNHSAPDSDTNWVIGDAAGVQEEPDPAALGPEYDTISDDSLRHTLHPANIRAVRIGLSIRSHRPDPGPPEGWAGEPLTFLGNRSSFTEYAPDTLPTVTGIQHRLRRFSSRTLVQTRNLGSKTLFLF